MARFKDNKAMAMLLVLVTIAVVMLLANIVLSTVVSQSRLTHHQVSRIQAYYAAQAGINYALDKLRRQDDTINWPIPASDEAAYTRRICRNCVAPDIAELKLPLSINSVSVKVTPAGTANCNPPAGIPVCVSATADYAYQ